MSPSCQNIMKLFLSSLVPEAVVTSLVLFLLLESCVFALTSSVRPESSALLIFAKPVSGFSAFRLASLCFLCCWFLLWSQPFSSSPWVPLALLVVPTWAPVRTELSTQTLGSLCVLGHPRVLGPLLSGQRPGRLCDHLTHFGRSIVSTAAHIQS